MSFDPPRPNSGSPHHFPCLPAVGLCKIAPSLPILIIAFIGIITLSVKERLLNKIILWLVGFAAGALIGGAFLHLIPEAVEESSVLSVGLYIILGFAGFFIIERFLYWRHCHDSGTTADSDRFILNCNKAVCVVINFNFTIFICWY